MLKQAIEAWRTDAPKLADWAEDNLAEGFTVFNFPQGHRVRLRTTNGLERVNREIEATHARRFDLPQRRILPATGLCAALGDR